MKLHLSNNLSIFIMAIMIFSIMPDMANAQKKCHNENCPNGYTCVNGYCVPIVIGCNCFARPIPPECGQLCGFYADPNKANDLLSISDINSPDISLTLIEAQNVSLKIYDLSGRLIKTL